MFMNLPPIEESSGDLNFGCSRNLFGSFIFAGWCSGCERLCANDQSTRASFLFHSDYSNRTAFSDCNENRITKLTINLFKNGDLTSQ